MAVIELVTESYTPSAPKKKPPRRRPTLPRAGRRGRGAGHRGGPRRGRGDRRGRRDQVVETEAADVETAEAQAETEATPEEPEAEESADEADRGACCGVRGRHQGLSVTQATPEARHHASGAGPSCVGSAAARSAGDGVESARWACTSGTTLAPSPEAAATRFIEPARMSPAANMPGDRSGQVGRRQAVGPELLGHVAAGEHEAVLVAAPPPAAASRTAARRRAAGTARPPRAGSPRRCSGRGPRSSRDDRRHHRRRPRRTPGCWICGTYFISRIR